jgi:thiosulfate dehydrogenase
MIKGLAIGFLLALVIMAGGSFLYLASGMAPVSTSDKPFPFEKKLANMALDARIKNQHVEQSPVVADEPNFLDGAKMYKQHCAVCHGLPNHPADLAKGMYPPPPQLFKGKGVTDDPASETYWKTANGIRMTGMPSFKDILTDTQSWQVSQLLAHADKISASVKEVLVPDVFVSTSTPTLAPESTHKLATK